RDQPLWPPIVPYTTLFRSRHGRQRERRQARLDREHHRRGEQQGERVLGEEDQPVPEEEADRLEVDRGAGHELPGLLRVEEPELEDRKSTRLNSSHDQISYA